MITVGKNWLNQGGSFNGKQGTVLMNGSSGSIGILESETFYSLKLNDGGGSATFDLYTDLDVNGTLRIAGGTLDIKKLLPVSSKRSGLCHKAILNG